MKKVMDNNKAVIYCRAVCQEQTSKDNSLDKQEKLCREFAEQNDIDVVDCIKEFESGTKMYREGLNKILSSTKKGGVSYVLVSDPTRLARSYKVYNLLQNLLMEHGVKVCIPCPATKQIMEIKTT